MVSGELIETGRDAAEVFEPAEHGLGPPAVFVARLVMVDRSLAERVPGMTGTTPDKRRCALS